MKSRIANSFFRALLIVSIIIISLGQLLRFPTAQSNFNIQALDVVIIGMVSLYIFYIYISNRLNFTKSWLSLIKLVTLILFTLPWLIHIEWFSSPGKYSALLYLLRFWIYIQIADIVINIIEYTHEATDIIRALLLVFGFHILSGFIQYIFIPDLHFLQFWGWDNHLYRLTGTILDPGYAGLLLILGLILLLPILSFNSKTPPFWVYISFVFGIISLALTFSRASFMSMVAALILWVILTRKYITVIAIVIALVIAIIFAPKPAGEGVNLSRTSTINFRLANWNIAWQVFQKSPVWGIGYNRYRDVQYQSGFINSSAYQESHSASGVDNSALFLLATTGLVGTSSFILLLGTLSTSLYLAKIRKKIISSQTSSYLLILNYMPEITLSSLGAISVHGMFHNSWFYMPSFLWLLILIGLALKVGKSEIN